MEQQQVKNFFRLNAGLNTEASEIGFPDGYTTDEANYELLVDGSRRRRKGLADEASQGTDHYTITFTSTQRCQSFVWRNVAGNPNKDVVVYRQGTNLFFADADSVISNGWATETSSGVDMSAFKTAGATTANSDDAPVTFTQGRGRLLVTGQYIKPFYVEYDSTAGYAAKLIKIRIRDFGDIDDGTSVDNEPTDATIPADHRYNLRNRGWSEDEISAYETTHSAWPARNMLWYRGYKRTYGASIYEADGQRSWDSNKIKNEAFGGSSAPRGALFVEPFDSTFGYGTGGAGGSLVNITTWSYVDSGSYWTVTLTTDAAHGIGVGDDFTIDGNSMIYYIEFYLGEEWDIQTSFDGTWEAKTGTTGSTLVFHWTSEPVTFDGWTNQYLTLGTADGSLSLARSTGSTHTDSVSAVEWHAGRAFYAGMSNDEWADTIFYSQIVDTTEKFGRCYQEADPTDEEFNQLVSTDGGTIVIPGMGGIINMVSVRNSLLVLGREGVWEVSGGQRGVFTADGYSVRKLSDAGASSASGITKIEDSVIYTGPGGIYIVAPNEYTGALEVTNVIQGTIQTLWNQVNTAKQERVECFYDDALKKAYFMYGPDGTNDCYIDTMLIFDARIGAWYKYTFDDTQTNLGILTGFPVPTVDDPTDNQKCKFFFQASTNQVNVADFNQTVFTDVTGLDEQLPYLYTGWDNIGDFQQRRQAPVITVYQGRTETGYTESPPGTFTAVNPSSTKMSGFWDWTSDATNEATTNKITATQQVYRHVRAFAPSAETDLDGYPVVVTRNKLRGRGRVLQLKFEGESAKDSHILGYTVNYKVSSGR